MTDSRCSVCGRDVPLVDTDATTNVLCPRCRHGVECLERMKRAVKDWNGEGME